MIRALVVASILTFTSLAAAAPNGTACTTHGDCDSGRCVDGVCCNSACSEQCEACDVTGSVGTCVPVVGAPHGARPACPGAEVGPCERATCDGTDRTGCRGFVGASVTCRAQSCKDGIATSEARCDGKGSCPAAISVSCGAYACGDATCRTSCTNTGDCGAAFVCRDSVCVAATSACSPDGLSIIAPDGTTNDCRPYRCVSGMCLAACAPGRDSDCMEGLVCSNDRLCVDPATLKKDEDDGGCVFSPRGVRTTGALAALALIAVVARRRFRG